MIFFIYTFDEQERHPALLREPDMMDTPPIQMLILVDEGIILTEVMPLLL